MRLYVFDIMKINSYDGTEIHYTSEGSGPALVCSYGIICGSYHFKYQTSYFKNHYQVIHYDYRGHNKSQLPKNLEDLTIKGSAYDLKAVLDDLGIEKAILMGHSMGAAVNMEFYRLFPDRVKAMIILCGSVTNPLEIMFYTDITKALFELLKLGFLKYPETLNSLWQNLPAGIGQTFVQRV
ncbi:MAG: alpha/beta hydrolase [Deltaproteobacteria bacterium]|nr:alpha/beta hydrolase [Deltaproteobacteria bacterium]